MNDIAISVSTTSLDPSSVVLEGLHLREGLSEPYVAEVSLRILDPELSLESLFEEDVVLVLDGGAQRRRLVGIATRLEEGQVDGGLPRLRLELRPALALLAQTESSRVFQGQSVPALVEALLRDALAPYKRRVRSELQGSYAPREHIVQYQESDLGFVHRLLEEEGIFYAFEHEGPQETLVLYDRSEKSRSVGTGEGVLRYSPVEEDLGDRARITELVQVRRSTSTSVKVRADRWLRAPERREEVQLDGEDRKGRARLVEVDGGHLPEAGNALDEVARRHLERARVGGLEVHGASVALDLSPGLRVSVVGHPTLGLDGDYLLTETTLEIRADEAHDAELGEPEGPRRSALARFSAIPSQRPFRPPRLTPKPRIHSVQTAEVVGPAGQATHTDEHGRIKIRLHWEREGAREERSSCWVRVAQGWAGAGGGLSAVPRIGSEVLVCFIDGDPDRPLVQGAVYNPANPPPAALPEEASQTRLRTQARAGAAAYNEILFEDKEGKEELRLHAGGALVEEVTTDRRAAVGGSVTLEVSKDQRVTIKGDKSVAVEGDQSVAVGGKEEATVKGDRSFFVQGEEAIHVLGDQRTEIGGELTLTSGGTLTISTKGKLILEAAQGIEIIARSGDVKINGVPKVKINCP